MVGKRAIVQILREQASEAQQQVQAEITLYHQLEAVAVAAQETSQESQSLLNAIASALATAQNSGQQGEQAASAAGSVAAAQHAMIEEAKHRLGNTLSQLQSAQADLQETETSALKAAESAQIAQSNAAAAGLAVAAASSKSQYGNADGHYHHH